MTILAAVLAAIGLAACAAGFAGAVLLSVAAAGAAVIAGTHHPVFAAAALLAAGASLQCAHLWPMKRPAWASLAGVAAGLAGCLRGGDWAWVIPMAITFTACYAFARRDPAEKPLTALKVVGSGAALATAAGIFGVIVSPLAGGLLK